MPLDAAKAIALVLETYALAGLAFAIVYLPRGAQGMDERLAGSPLLTRVLIFPGVAALWPLLAWRWLRRTHAPVESNPHRRRAAGDSR
jgi:hypothetical protein